MGINGIGYGMYMMPAQSMGYDAVVGARGTESAGKTGVDATGMGGKGVSASGECQTCKNRKYVDGSNEGNVSFKTPAHISPENSAAAVRSHEQEHVANARAKGSKENAELVSANVRLHTSVCPECGRAYVSGGVTTTTIKYTNEENPYTKMKKAMDADAVAGSFVDMAG
ncbi:MAG: hypothetical protein IKK96_00405 [Lachnospiraceae bacterium]|nr:hypothetical protein [Lachnospiraceae bacterium]